jgi:hypothetical protein
LRLERDILKKLRRSSGNRRDEVSPDRGSPGSLASAGHVRGAERVTVRLLRVAVAARGLGRSARARSPIARSWPIPAGSCAASGTVRGAAHPGRAACRGPEHQPQAGRAGDAPARHPGPGAAAISRVHNRQQAFPADRGQPAGPQFRGREARSDLVGRYPLHPDRRGLVVPGRDPRPVHPENRRLGDARAQARRTHHGRTDQAIQRRRPAPDLVHHWDRAASMPPATTAKSCRPPPSPNR